MSYTQQEKILVTMVRGNKDWYLPQDFMQAGLGELFVGYEASARLSEMAKDYPDLIISERQGKYMARKLNKERIGFWLSSLPKSWQTILTGSMF